MYRETASLTMKTKNDPIARVRELNDNFRRNIFDRALGTLIFTAGVAALMDSDRFALMDEVRCFEDFNEGNDPYKEHDFGAIDFKGDRYFWKIDYYDNAMEMHSLDKSNPNLTKRVLTIMQACEY
jgi:hypothetical protein